MINPDAQIFVDMDGVLADFDAHHEAHFGFRPDKKADNVDWEKVRAIPGFYNGIPPMKDAHDLWLFLMSLWMLRPPIILTGVPSSVAEAADNKQAWVRKYLGPDVQVIATRSSQKSLYAKPGDILIDDWEKYKGLWVGKGGIWITHTSTASTIEQLLDLGAGL